MGPFAFRVAGVLEGPVEVDPQLLTISISILVPLVASSSVCSRRFKLPQLSFHSFNSSQHHVGNYRICPSVAAIDVQFSNF